ncbi:MAG: DUF4164 family protein [bacterium]|nr:DUF4164 family protein [bacterium]
MTLGETSALDLAARRLERAVAQLEQRLAAQAARPPAPTGAGDLFDGEAARLKAELDAARERERALEEAGEQASVALGRAIAEIRAALGEDPGTANDDAPHDDEPETDDLFDESEKA